MELIPKKVTLFLQVLVYLFCILCVLLGFCLILISVLLLYRPRATNLIPEYNVGFIGSIVVFGGMSSIITALVGLYGIFKLKQGSILVYGISLPIVAYFLLLTANICLGYNKEINPIVAEELHLSMYQMYGKRQHEKFTNDVDQMQTELGCCGAYGFKDYQKMQWNSNNPIALVPLSCCIVKTSGCNHRGIHGDFPEQKSSIYTKGCAETIRKWINYYIKVAGFVTIALSILQFISAYLAYIIYEYFDFYLFGRTDNSG